MHARIGCTVGVGLLAVLGFGCSSEEATDQSGSEQVDAFAEQPAQDAVAGFDVIPDHPAADGRDAHAETAADAQPPLGDASQDDGDSVDAQLDHDAAAPPPDAGPPEKDIDQIPWNTGGNVGFGVASKDTENPQGNNFFLAYAGYNVDLDSAEKWATALYRASLRDRGVRYVWAVQGPNNPSYSNLEIGNSKIIAAMLPMIDASTKFVLAVGHSSGSFVAHELLGQLEGGLDPSGVTNKRVVYFNLDGGGGLSAAAIARLRRAYFVASFMSSTGTYSPNASTMQSLGQTYASAGGYYENNADGSGCHAGAQWCVHVTLINTKPHNPDNGDPVLDYSDFGGRPVCQSYVDAKASEAQLDP